MRESRSSGRRRLTARLAALLLTLAAALALLLPGGVGQAQTAASLVEVEGGGTQIAFDGERALGIATAASAGTGNDGWLVTEVELRIRPDDGTGTDRTATPPGLAICESDADGDPDGTCYPLIAPGAVEIPTAMTTGQEVTYATPGSGHFLTAGTNYTLHFTENGSTHANGLHHLDASGNDGEAAHVAGTFRNALRELRSDGTWGSSSSNVAWARITGYASTTPTETPPGEALISNIGADGGRYRDSIHIRGRRPGVHDRDRPRRLHADQHRTQATKTRQRRDHSPNGEAAPRFPHRRGGGDTQRPVCPGRAHRGGSTRSGRPPPSPSARPPATFWSPRAVRPTGKPPAPAPPTAHPGMAGRSKPPTIAGRTTVPALSHRAPMR